jgi:glycosyltransferase involved in cell wall biosynthesis
LKISVAIPTYNRANLIGQTLNAVFKQTRKPDEIIVVDDGSTDSTPSLLKGIDGVRLITIPNSGDLVARNTALRNAKGELVAFCDSDDLWQPQFLEEMSRQWEIVPDLVASYSNFRTLKDGELSGQSKFDTAPLGYWDKLRSTGMGSGVFDFPIVDRLISFQPLFTSCMMVSRNAFLALGGWDEGASRLIGCDFATALRVGAAPPLGIVKQPLVSIRKHSGNISGDTERMNLGDADVLEYVLRTRPNLAPLRYVIERSIADRRSAALDSAFVRKDFAAVRKIYKMLPNDLRRGKTLIKRLIASIAPGL